MHGCPAAVAIRSAILYDVTPAKFGQVNSVITQADNFGKLSRVNDFFNVTLNARLGRAFCSAAAWIPDAASTTPASTSTLPARRTAALPGTSSDRRLECCPRRRRLRDDDQRPQICRIVTPFRADAVEGLMTYPLPWDFMVSAVFQNISGPTITANYAATNAQIAPSLGRNLAACRGAVVCTAHGHGPADRAADDVRRSAVATRPAVGETHRPYATGPPAGQLQHLQRVQRQCELDAQHHYGPLWLQPSLLQDGRMLQFSGLLTF